uniref:Protein sleepless n=1 Tax=Panagrellus redivivus TaxID=6233 RepID=A0A7E4V2D4_PANRE
MLTLIIAWSLLLPIANGIICHHCWFNSSEVSKRHLFDRIDASPSYCETSSFCEGMAFIYPSSCNFHFLGSWCSQRLSGDNISFTCAERSPLVYLFRDKDILSQCQAISSFYGVSSALCYCRSGDYCNTGQRPSFHVIFVIFVNFIIRVLQ